MMLTSVYDNLSVYGQPLNLKSRIALWRAILERQHGYSMSLVLDAILKHCGKSNSMPTPADIIKILEPEDDKITIEEYRHACRQYQLEGCMPHSNWKAMMNAYEDQQAGIDPAERYRKANEQHRLAIENLNKGEISNAKC